MNKIHDVHQIHFFTDNSQITPTPLIIKSFIDELSAFDMIPSFAHEINAASGEKRQFLLMVDTNNQYRIEFLSSEIVITGTNETIDNFKSKAQEILKKVSKIFPNKKANRLSVISNTVFFGETESYEKIYKGMFTYKQANPIEWDNRIVKRKNLKEEEINIISNIRRCKIQAPFINGGSLSDCIIFELDTNTIAENTTYRFLINDSESVIDGLVDEIKLTNDSLKRYTEL